MAKKNNKGFSLIEIMIAIAILTILLTPIIRQLTLTLNVNRKAKEQQYANERAVYDLESFQNTPYKDLDSIYGVPEVPTATAKCKLYSYDSSSSAVTELGDIEYNVKQYTLGTIKLGPGNVEYNRDIVVDDLANKVGAYVKDGKNYRIAYGLTETELALLSGSELTSEGSVVRYGDLSTGSGSIRAVNAILCVPVDDAQIKDPNQVNLGNMHNLENDTVALVTGMASNYDAQAETSFYSKAMDRLKEIDKASWEQALLHKSDDSVLNQYAYSSAIEKCTKIYVDELTDDLGKKYYIVKVDVYYDNTYSLTVNGKTTSFEDPLEYNVFTQKFYTKECPDIYIEYQPYTIDVVEVGGTYDVTYDDIDYIVLDNHVEGAKLYLYKPFQDQLSVSEGVDESIYQQAPQTYYTDSSKSTKVSIHLASVSSTAKQMKIFTNLDTSKTPVDGSNPQFVCDSFSGHFKEVVSDKAGVSKSRVPFARDVDVDNDGVTDEENLKYVTDDERVEDRLYTVTVTLIPTDDDKNTVSLTGAKGDN